MHPLQALLDAAWENRTEFSPTSAPADVRQAVEEALAALDRGELRVAEKVGGEWTVHQWLKKAVLLSFRLNDNGPMGAGDLQYWDKVPLKKPDGSYR
ncbi:2,3,4,5-tetrahydropyridine-2,6-dicarboxylate N-succinyltransferase, partial [bacterium]